MVAHSVYEDPGWIPSLPLSKKWHRAALCFSATAALSVSSFWEEHRWDFSCRKPLSKTQSCFLPSEGRCWWWCWAFSELESWPDTGDYCSSATNSKFCSCSFLWMLQRLMSLSSDSALSPPHFGTLTSQLTWPDRTEERWLVISQRGLEERGRWRDAGTVTSSLL